jgi:hypothetical protein
MKGQARLHNAGRHTKNVPFFEVPPKRKPHAPLAVMVFTFPCTVCGNHARPEWVANPAWRQDCLHHYRAVFTGTTPSTTPRTTAISPIPENVPQRFART